MAHWSIEEDHLEAASRAIAGRALVTPLRAFEELGARVALKLESAQDTGSFKLRGALAALAALPPGVSEVVTASAGNHGYGMARAGGLLGIGVRVFVSQHAPASKREGIASAGATLSIVEARSYDAVERAARDWALEHEARFVSPFDDPLVAAGNGGTLGLEILASRPGVQTIVAPVGGGGLIAGLAAVRRLRGAEFRLVGVQSEACPAMVESLRDGRAHLTYEGAPTLAEGLEGGVSESTFRIVRDEVDSMELVSEEAIGQAMRWSKERGLVLEGSAAVTVAWLRARTPHVEDVVGIASGSNV